MTIELVTALGQLGLTVESGVLTVADLITGLPRIDARRYGMGPARSASENSAALAAALAAAAAAGGGTVVLPRGSCTYDTAPPVITTHAVAIVGHGASRNAAANSASALIYTGSGAFALDFSGCQGVALSGFYLDGQGASGGAGGIRATVPQNWRVDSVFVRGFPGRGWHVLDSAAASGIYNLWTNCTAIFCATNFDLDAPDAAKVCNSNVFIDCAFGSATAVGMKIGSRCNEAALIGVDVSSSPVGLDNSGRNTTMQACTVENCSSAGIDMTSATASIFGTAQISGNGVNVRNTLKAVVDVRSGGQRYQGGGKGCSVDLNGVAQSVASGSYVDIIPARAVYDDGGMLVGGGSANLTLKRTGLWLGTGAVDFAGSGTGSRIVRLVLGGVEIQRGVKVGGLGAGQRVAIGPVVFQGTATQNVKLQVFQDSGGNLDVNEAQLQLTLVGGLLV